MGCFCVDLCRTGLLLPSRSVESHAASCRLILLCCLPAAACCSHCQLWLMQPFEAADIHSCPFAEAAAICICYGRTLRQLALLLPVLVLRRTPRSCRGRGPAAMPIHLCAAALPGIKPVSCLFLAFIVFIAFMAFFITFIAFIVFTPSWVPIC